MEKNKSRKLEREWQGGQRSLHREDDICPKTQVSGGKFWGCLSVEECNRWKECTQCLVFRLLVEVLTSCSICDKCFFNLLFAFQFNVFTYINSWFIVSCSWINLFFFPLWLFLYLLKTLNCEMHHLCKGMHKMYVQFKEFNKNKWNPNTPNHMTQAKKWNIARPWSQGVPPLPIFSL